MRVSLRKSLAVLCIGLTAVLGLGVSESSRAETSTAANKPADKIVLGLGIGTEASDLIIAVKNGFFKNNGIDATIRHFANGNDAMDTILTGNIDIADATEPGALMRRAKGGAIYIAGMGPRSGDNNSFIATSDIKQPKDLEGKAVGVPKGSSANYFFVNYLKRFNLDASKIKHVNGDPPDLLAALNRGDIAGMFIWDPWPRKAADTISNVRVVQKSGENDVYFAQQYYYVSQRLVDNKELGERVMRSIVDANKWVKTHMDETAKIVAAEIRQPEDQVRTLLGAWSWGSVTFTPQTRTNVAGAAAFLKDENLITTAPDLSTYLRPEMLKAVDPAAVTID
jgi:NitT/TauT family transport system substrate-binding protein